MLHLIIFNITNTKFKDMGLRVRHSHVLAVQYFCKKQIMPPASKQRFL